MSGVIITNFQISASTTENTAVSFSPKYQCRCDDQLFLIFSELLQQAVLSLFFCWQCVKAADNIYPTALMFWLVLIFHFLLCEITQPEFHKSCNDDLQPLGSSVKVHPHVICCCILDI